MRQLLLLISVALILGVNVNAQDATQDVILLNYKTLAKKAASSDAAIEDEKKGIKPTTWMKRGKLYQDVFNEGLEQLQLGAATSNVRIFYGDPLSQTDPDEKQVEIYKYETINYHFELGKLRAWSRNNPIHERPLHEAFRSYKKGIELTDPEKQGKAMDKIKDDLTELKDQFQTSGQSHYFLGNFEDALADFEAILAVNELPVFEGVTDTMMINFSGIVAREIGRVNEDEASYRKAIDYYKTLTELEYGGINMYIQMTRDYYAIGDTLGAIDNLKRGLEQYPDSAMLVTLTAQAYYLTNDNDGGIAFVDQRIEETPNCADAYYWKGLLLTNHGDLSEDTITMALELYDKALEIDPGKYEIWYQSGYVNYAVGANYYEREGYEDDEDLRAELIEKGHKFYVDAAEKLEKTYEVATTDPSIQEEALDLLKRIYYKLYGGDDQRYLDVMDRINAQ